MGLFSSFKKTDSSPAARSSAGPVRRGDIAAVQAGAGWQAIALRGQEAGGLWPSFAVDFLLECDEFKPLPEHLSHYARRHSLEHDQMREIAAWAGKMASAGLLSGANRVIERCAAASTGGESSVRLAAIGIPTAGNETRLRRAIGSFARNAREHGRAVEFGVSCNGPAQAAPIVEEIAREESVKISLYGDAERAAFCDRLARKAGVDPAIPRFAMGDPFGAGFACGANRNTMMLHNAGRPWLNLDDDMVCEMEGAPDGEAKEGTIVFSSRDAFERWFYPAYQDAFEAGGGGQEEDYLGLHERMLGRAVSGFLKGDVEFAGTSDVLFRRLQETDGRIIATFTGHFGHPGVPTSYYYLTYRRKTLRRLTGEGEERYRAYLSSGAVRALAPRMAIADASLSPGMAIGIDARDLIPPFPPVMHAEDFVWGAAVWLCRATGFAGHLPVAVRHDPGLGRGILAPPLAGHRPVAIWEFAHLLRGMLQNWSPAPGMVETPGRMDSLGRWLCEIAGGDAADFREYQRWFILQHESDKISYMERCIEEEEDAPEFWRRDIGDYIEQTRLALREPDFDIPFDMRGKYAEPRALIQSLIYEYGRLLRAWPALFDAAREIQGNAGL